MKKTMVVTAILLALIVMISACSPPKPIRYLMVGTNADSYPFAMRGGEDNSAIVGFDAALAQIIADQTGLPLKMVDLKPDELLPALNEGKVDLILGGLKATDALRQAAAFSEPYYNATPVVVIIAGGAVPETREDLRDQRLAVQEGSSGDQVSTSLTGPKEIHRFPSPLEAVVCLMNSQADVAVLDAQLVGSILARYPELMTGDVEFDPVDYSVAVRKDDLALLGTVNQVLAAMQADGRLDQLIDDWMLQNPVVTDDLEASE